MNLRSLHIFITVYQTQNITQAAERLYMTQPAVTRTIRELESDYDIRLFDRLHRRLKVTEAGQRFYQYALRVLEACDRMEDGMRHWNETGVLDIGATVTIGTVLLPKVLSVLKKKHPDLKIKAKVANQATLKQALMDNTLDFAVIEGHIPDEDLNFETIGQDTLCPVLPPDFSQKPRTLEELLNNPLILREKGSAGRASVDHHLALAHLEKEPFMESISTQAIIHAVHQGLGISFLPAPLIQNDLDQNYIHTCKLTDVSFTRLHDIVWHKDKYLTDIAKEAMELLKELSK